MKAGVIAFPLDRPVRGGIDRYVHRLALEFAAGRRAADFVWIHGTPFSPFSPMAGARQAILKERGPLAALARRRWSRRNPEGLSVLWGPYFGVLPGPFAKVMTVHDLYAFTSRDAGFLETAKFRAATRRMVQASDWILADSKATRLQLLALFDFPDERVVTVHLGVDPPASPPRPQRARAELREQFGWPADAKVVLFVGALIPRKAPDALVRAHARVLKTLPKARLLLFGPRAQGARAVDAAIADLSPSGTAAVAPKLDDAYLETAYAGADVLALPSKFEGFGLPALEAMARGLPTVLSSGGALAEIGAGACEQVAPGDEAALADALLRVLTDEAAARDLAERGRARASQFTWSRCAAETLHVLDAAGES